MSLVNNAAVMHRNEGGIADLWVLPLTPWYSLSLSCFWENLMGYASRLHGVSVWGCWERKDDQIKVECRFAQQKKKKRVERKGKETANSLPPTHPQTSSLSQVPTRHQNLSPPAPTRAPEEDYKHVISSFLPFLPFLPPLNLPLPFTSPAPLPPSSPVT